MTSSQHQYLGLVGSLLLVSTKDAFSFTIPSSSQGSHVKFSTTNQFSRYGNLNNYQTNTILYAAGTGATGDYLASLSNFEEAPVFRASVTERYLESLSQIADSSPAYSTYSPEEYLTKLPQQIVEATAAGITDSNVDTVAGNAGIYLADASVGVSVGIPDMSDASTIATSTIASSTPLSSTSTFTADDLTSQLSGLSYDTVIQTGPKVQQLSSGATSGPGSSLTDSLLGVKNAAISSIGNVVGSAGSGAADKISKTSLEDLGSDVAGSIQLMGNSLGQVLNAVDGTLQDNMGLTLTGTTSTLVKSAQLSIATVVNSAVHSITETIQNKIYEIGNMTVSEVLQNLVSLVIIVSRLLFSILNAIIKVISGQGLTDWAVGVTGAIEQKAAALSMQATSAAADLTHKSLFDLTNSVATYSQDVADGVTTMASHSIDGVSVALASAHLF